MTVEITIVVTDASPLITLASAKSLAYLLYPGLPVLIPDAVFYEATASAGKLGAVEIIEWYRAHMDEVRVEPTEIFQREMKVLEALGGRIPRDIGERSAVELVRAYPLRVHEKALLLSDDRDVERLSIVDPGRLVLLTTWDFLVQLEEARRIQSAEAIVAAARDAGRMPRTTGLWDSHDPDVREAVKTILERPRR